MLKTSSDFIQEIEQIAKEKKIPYLDALMVYVEKYNIEPESIAAIVKKSTTFKSKLFEECDKLNLMVKKK